MITAEIAPNKNNIKYSLIFQNIISNTVRVDLSRATHILNTSQGASVEY